MLAFFEEEVEMTLVELFGALAGVEIPVSRFVRKLACISFDAGFLDGACVCVCVCVCGACDSSIHCPSKEKE